MRRLAPEGNKTIMSALIVSALLATTLNAVPSSFGSEPYVFDLEAHAAPARTQVAGEAPTLATSLGSEPLMLGADSAPLAPAGEGTVVEQRVGVVTLATSLGSEPFILGGSDETAPVLAAAPRGARAGEKLATK
jgi:hypothetical protein